MGRALARIFCCRREPALTRQNPEAGGGGALPQGTQLQGTSGYRGDRPLAGRTPSGSVNECPVDVPGDPGSAQNVVKTPVDVPADPGSTQDVTETPVDVPADPGSSQDVVKTPVDVPVPSQAKSGGKKKKDKTKHWDKPTRRYFSDSDSSSISSSGSDSSVIFNITEKFWAFDNRGFQPEVYPAGSPLTQAV